MGDGIRYANYTKKCKKYGFDPENIISREVLDGRLGFADDFKRMY
jgi:hypothetical protein